MITLMKLLVESIGQMIWEYILLTENCDFNRYMNAFGIQKPNVNV